MSWTGPNIQNGALSVLHLHNIDRNQAGTYMCTASNYYDSKTSLAVSVVVECEYQMLLVIVSFSVISFEIFIIVSGKLLQLILHNTFVYIKSIKCETDIL